MAGFALGADPANLAELRRGFERPPDDARMMVRWWWFGPAVTKPELEREMRAMKEGGIGGFEVQPAYPLELDNPAKGFNNLPYLRPEFLDALHLHRRQGEGTGTAHGSDSGQRMAVRRPAHSGRAGVASAARAARRAGRDTGIAEGEKLIAVFVDGKRVAVANGKVSAPAGSGQATFFIAGHTGRW